MVSSTVYLIIKMEQEGQAEATLSGALTWDFIFRGHQSINKGGEMKGRRRLGLDPASLLLPMNTQRAFCWHPACLSPSLTCGAPRGPVASIMYSGTVGAGATPTPLTGEAVTQFIAKRRAPRESRAPGQGEHPSPGWPYRMVGWDKSMC